MMIIIQLSANSENAQRNWMMKMLPLKFSLTVITMISSSFYPKIFAQFSVFMIPSHFRSYQPIRLKCLPPTNLWRLVTS